MNFTNPNGPSWSPDGGRFWRKDGKLYWSDGEITDDGGIMREMPTMPGVDYSHYENYSEWSDEKRAEVKAKLAAERAELARLEKLEEDEIKALCISAKAKLTKEEYDAIQWSRYSHENPWFMWEDLP